MFALKYTNIGRPALALTTLILCSVLATGAYADHDGHDSSNGSKGKASSRQKGSHSRDRSHSQGGKTHSQGSKTYTPAGGATRSGGPDHASRANGSSHGNVNGVRPNGVGRPDGVGRPQGAHQGFSAHAGGLRPGASFGHVEHARFVAPRDYHPATLREGRYYYPSVARARPCYYGHWAFSLDVNFSRRSCYFFYGYFPYVETSRVYVLPYASVTYVEIPVSRSDGYYLEKAKDVALDSALSDIRGAWTGARYDQIEQHVSSADKIAVLLDGKYDYSVDADDYLTMTHDAIEQMKTESFTWDKVKGRSDGGYTAFATHVYNDASGATRTIYVSYTLQMVGKRYYITEVGSSESPLI